MVIHDPPSHAAGGTVGATGSSGTAGSSASSGSSEGSSDSPPTPSAESSSTASATGSAPSAGSSSASSVGSSTGSTANPGSSVPLPERFATASPPMTNRTTNPAAIQRPRPLGAGRDRSSPPIGASAGSVGASRTSSQDPAAELGESTPVASPATGVRSVSTTIVWSGSAEEDPGSSTAAACTALGGGAGTAASVRTAWP